MFFCLLRVKISGIRMVQANGVATQTIEAACFVTKTTMVLTVQMGHLQ
jgi:hypothetical protein